MEEDTYLGALAELIKERTQKYAQVQAGGTTIEEVIGDIPEHYRAEVRTAMLHLGLLALLDSERGTGVLSHAQHEEFTAYLRELVHRAALAPPPPPEED